MKHITAPFEKGALNGLKAGDIVRLSGVIITGRDAAHKRLFAALDTGLPVDVKDQCIYYVGPCPAKEGEVIGPCGPTTAYRVDSFTPALLDAGLKGMIGKGFRSPEVIEAMKRNGAVYFTATGGAACLIQQCVKKADVIAYDDLGAEAIYRLTVEDMPLIVAIDSEGNSLYER